MASLERGYGTTREVQILTLSVGPHAPGYSRLRFSAAPAPLAFGSDAKPPTDPQKLPGADKPEAPAAEAPKSWGQRLRSFFSTKQPETVDQPYFHIPECFDDFLATSFMNDDWQEVSGLAIVKALIAQQKKCDGQLSDNPDFVFGKQYSYRGLLVEGGERSKHLEVMEKQFGFRNKTSQLLMFRNLREGGILQVREEYVKDDDGHTTIKRAAYLSQAAQHLYQVNTLKGPALKRYMEKHPEFFKGEELPQLTTYTHYMTRPPQRAIKTADLLNPPANSPARAKSKAAPAKESVKPAKAPMLQPDPGRKRRMMIAAPIFLSVMGLLGYASYQQERNSRSVGEIMRQSQPAEKPLQAVSPTQAGAPKQQISPSAVGEKATPAPTGRAAQTAKPAAEKPDSNQFATVEEALVRYQSGKFEQRVIEIPHHNGLYSYEFLKPTGKAKGETTSYFLSDINQADRTRLRSGLAETGYAIVRTESEVSRLEEAKAKVAGQTRTEDRVFYGIMGVLFLVGMLAMRAKANGGQNSELAKKQLEIMKRQVEAQEASMNFGKMANGAIDEPPPDRLSDVGGNHFAKAELTDLISKIKRIGEGEDIQIPRGILLEGPPGNGKTLMARATAGEAGVPFFSISGSELVQMYVGVGASRVRDIFKQAKENAPCIIFIDEIDAIAKARSTTGAGGNDERESTLNQILQEMDGFERNDNVFVLAATNRKDLLDVALTNRPSRFKYTIKVDDPRSDEERLEILSLHAQKTAAKEKVSFDGSVQGRPLLEKLATFTRGSNGDTLMNTIQEAAAMARKRHQEENPVAVVEGDREGATAAPQPEEDTPKPLVEVTFKDCVEANQRLKDGPVNKVKTGLRSRRKVNVHEDGHALAFYSLFKLAPTVISMLERGQSLGRVILDTSVFDEKMMSVDDILSQVLLGMGGTAAEEYEYGPRGRCLGLEGDVQRVQDLIKALISHGLVSTTGQAGENYAVDMKPRSVNELAPEEKVLLNKIANHAKNTVKKMWEAVGGRAKLAEMVQETLDLEHELIGDDSTEFVERHWGAQWEKLHAIAESFLENPTGDETSVFAKAAI